MWGFSGIGIKLVSTTGLVTACYRLWFAILPLWLTMLKPSLRRRLDADWLRASVGGGILFSLHQILFFSSLKLTSVANVTIIGALQPVLVLLVAGPLFGERTTPRAALWALVALSGTALVVFGASHTRDWSLRGDLLAGLNLFAFTAYFLASKRFRQRVGAWEYVVGMTTVAGIVLVAVTVATRQPHGSPAPWEWLVLLGLAIFPGTLGHVLSNWAHAHVPVFVASMILLAVPVVASVGAVLVLGEELGPMQIAGGMVVLIAIAIIVRGVRSAADVMVESVAGGEAP